MLKIRDANGDIIHFKAIKGRDGKSAYEYAVEAGFTGTEQEFIHLLIDSNDVIYDHMIDHMAHADIRELLARLADKYDNTPTEFYIENEILAHDLGDTSHADIRELIAVLREEFDALPDSIDLVSTHNTSDTSHTDIRELIQNLTTRLNALADSDDIDLDQLSELVTYIKSNRSLIESITTNKANVSDIVDDLITASSNKMLSANMGVELKKLVDSKAPLDHTHKYAGSSSAGGSADSAVKLDTSAGSKTQPVYFSNGKPVACDFTLDSQVPSDAVFTDDKVAQENTTDDSNYRVLLSGTDDNMTHTESAKKNEDFYYNPSTGTLTVKAIAMANATITNNTEKGAIVFRFS